MTDPARLALKTAAILTFLLPATSTAFGSDRVTTRFREEIRPILEEKCAGCHANGIKKGNFSFDADEGDAEAKLLGDQALWSSVLRNVRAGIMPPSAKPQPTADELKLLGDWVKHDVLGLDPANPDPGRVTLRRLNRVEYRNTIRDLMGIDFRTDEEFPPDDTGYGFDNVADVLSVSPLLLEKYVQAAETIVGKAVPSLTKAVPERVIPGQSFRRVVAEGDVEKPKAVEKGRRREADALDFYREAALTQTFRANADGDYTIGLNLDVLGEFEFDPGRCDVTFKVDGEERRAETIGWANHKRLTWEPKAHLAKGEHTLRLELKPLTAVEKRKNSLKLRVIDVRLVGPLDPKTWAHPKNYERFFPRDEPPANPEGRKAYAREVLEAFATKAYRRPVDAKTVDRLVALAGNFAEGTFEESVARPMIAVLASPRFLFRVEGIDPLSSDQFPAVDEYALASRLSYFLWSTMPDATLTGLASRGALRKNLREQVGRMLKDSRSSEFTRNFVGQWLQVRDVEGIAINAPLVLARDRGVEKEVERERREFRARIGNPKAQPKKPPRFLQSDVPFDGPLRTAMREETEASFAYVVNEDRSVLELIDANYVFVNERLAKHYGIKDVKGPEIRKVTLPDGHIRGGIITQGATLVVTSNPTRTSPVKRGLFLLENVLGTPPPPPPPDIPPLEEAEKAVEGNEPTTRVSLEIHRNKPLCASCHARMDPLGLALESFNAMGMFRETERNRPVDPTGTLLTGQKFKDVRDVKRVLAHDRRGDVYRCMSEKLLTYALGRGLDDRDVESVDQVVDRLEKGGGKFSALLAATIDSAPFQKTRRITTESTAKGPTPPARTHDGSTP